MAIRAGLHSGKTAAVAAAAVLLAAAASAGAPPASASADAALHWRITKMITVPDTVLNDVAALPGGTAWAGGQTPARRESVYQLSGGQWHAGAVSGPPGAFIATVSATSPANIWFSNNADQVGRRSGSSWVITSFGPAPAVQLDGVVTTGPHDTWAFTYNPMTAQALAHHYNGTSWQATTLPAAVGSFTFTGMESASSSSNIWTWAYTNSGDLTMHYNGVKWQTISLPANLVPAGQLLQPKRILAESPGNVWATAYTYTVQGGGEIPGPIVLLHWHGHSWTKITGPLPSGALTGPIAPDGDGGLWLSAVSPHDVPFLLHYSASGAWATYPMPAQTAGEISVTALALIPGTRSVLGVGDVGFNSGDTSGAAFLQYHP
jgi:hypothetical protein